MTRHIPTALVYLVAFIVCMVTPLWVFVLIGMFTYYFVIGKWWDKYRHRAHAAVDVHRFDRRMRKHKQLTR